jgi:TolB-like protein/Tfp pilus assembly protein PilF
MNFRFGDYRLDVERRELQRGADLVPVEPQVFDLLVYLVRNRDRVVSKDDLVQGVWNGRIVSDSTLTSRINAARKAVGDSGEQQALIRTIARKGLRFVGDVQDAGAADAAPGASPPPAPFAMLDRPSIAVMAFANMGGDREQDYFADGIAEDIMMALLRARWFFVIARDSSFAYKDRDVDIKQIARELGVRYILRGSVRSAEGRVRVSAQLVDGDSGSNVWARSYDRDLSDIFAVQDEIAQAIVGAIEPQLGRAERERAKVKVHDLDAWTLYQRGMFHLYRCTREDLAEARRLFQEAAAVDPDLALAFSGLAETYYYEVVYGFAQSNDRNREAAIGPAQHAVTLDPECAISHCTLGRIRYLRREYAPAMSSLRTAIELNPCHALAHYGMGATLVFSGRSAQAFPYLGAAIRFSPSDPNMGSFLVRLADARYFTGDYEEAASCGVKALGQQNFQWSRYAVLIAALGQLGRIDEAQRYLGELRNSRPDFSIAFVKTTHLFGDRFDMEHYCDGLLMAGVPERA